MRGTRHCFLLVALLVVLMPAAGASAATFKVTKTADTDDGHCNQDCSLREAIDAANATPRSDKVKLGPKTYALTIEGSGADNATGDLDVVAPLKLTGAGPSKTAIVGAWAADPDGLIELATDTSLQASGIKLTDHVSGSSGVTPVYASTGSKLKLDHVAVTRNRSEYSAVDNLGHAVLSHVTFTRNTGSCCPAFYNDGEGAIARLTNVTFDHNTAEDDTGAVYSSGDRATLKRVTFSNNIAGDVGGGALISTSGILNLTNVTFWHNQTKGDGGGLYVESGSVNNLNNVTFSRNVADSDSTGGGDGGGLYNDSGGSSPVNVRNTIIAGNVDNGGEAPDCGQNSGDAFTSRGFNLLGAGPAGCTVTLLSSDTASAQAGGGLLPLAANGGFTKTVALKKSSKAVDRGSGAAPGSGGSACDKHDQRGVKRPQGKRCDIGAYERKP